MIDGAIVSYLGCTIDDGGVAMDRAEAFANVWRQSHGTDFWQQYIEQVSWCTYSHVEKVAKLCLVNQCAA
jgi:hypothetical protein